MTVRCLARIVTVVTIVFTLAIASAPAQGMERDNGENWTYDVYATTEIMGVEANLTGSITFAFSGVDVVDVGASHYESNVMDISGTMSGPLRLYELSVGSADLTLSGEQYEDRSSVGIVKEDLTAVGTASFGTGVFSLAYDLRSQVVLTTAPPILSEFHPENVVLGTTWSQTVEVASVTNLWENGTLSNTTYLNESLSYSAEVAPSLDSVETPAGVFESIKVTVTDSSGNRDAFWWSTAVNNFVKHEVRLNGTAAPVLTVVLADHGSKGSSSGLIVIGVGASVLAIGVAVLLFVLFKRRPEKPQPTTVPAPSAGSSR